MDLRAIRILLFSFVAIILIGAFILSLSPFHNGKLSFIDSLFTATSAVCVTGLIVKDTAKDFTIYGQSVILLLIQIGGFGYMTLATILILILKKKVGLQGKLLLRETLDYHTIIGIVGYMKRVIYAVLLIELIGAFILFFAFYNHSHKILPSIWNAVFHSISAFNNAGFSLFSSNMMDYRDDFIVNITISLLIILGGIGYFVLVELYKYYKLRIFHLSIHTKIVLITTSLLILAGILITLFFEWNNDKTIGRLPIYYKILTSFFYSVNLRTAGFNTIDVNSLSDSVLFFSSLLMGIGGSPGGTAGGMKVTVFAVLILYAWNTGHSEDQVVVFKRAIPSDVISRSYFVFFITSIYITFTTIMLTVEAGHSFLSIFVEVNSAFSTVGLSVGDGGGILSLSAAFDTFGKSVIIGAMIAGRIGVAVFTLAILGRNTQSHIKYPEGRINI